MASHATARQHRAFAWDGAVQRQIEHWHFLWMARPDTIRATGLVCGSGGRGRMQLHPGQTYDHRLAERVILYLQTKNASLFPFTFQFDDARRRAFIHDLREALSDLQDSG